MTESSAVVAGMLLTEPLELIDDPAKLSKTGHWAVLASFENSFRAVRFATAKSIAELPVRDFVGVSNWESSLDQASYQAGVLAVQEQIRAGWVYQVNLCRILRAQVSSRPDAIGLWQRIMQQHPTRFASYIDLLPGELDEAGIWFVSASPELFLLREGNQISSAPIKGTAVTADQMLEKDYAENIMITDMVRNDLGQIAITGSVKVAELLKLEHIPGLVQLVSTVTAQLRPEITWPEIFQATFPPASVTGAPKLAALSVISELEPVDRGGYCGAVGYINEDRAELAVGIRSFEYLPGELRFGTGAGITLGSDPLGEWQETQLKAERLIKLASAND